MERIFRIEQIADVIFLEYFGSVTLKWFIDE